MAAAPRNSAMFSTGVVPFLLSSILPLLLVVMLALVPSGVPTVAAVPLREFQESRRIGVTTRSNSVEVMSPAGEGGSGDASGTPTTPLPMAGIFGDLQSPAASSYSFFVAAMASLQPHMDYVGFLNGAVNMANGITILAPNNAAFQVLGPYATCLSNYTRSGPILATLLNHHILYGTFPESALFDGQQYYTLANTHVLIARNTTGVYVEDALMVEPNKFTGYNGMVHGIDRVMFPPDITPSLFVICNQTGPGLAV